MARFLRTSVRALVHDRNSCSALTQFVQCAELTESGVHEDTMHTQHPRELLFKGPKDWQRYYEALLLADGWWAKKFAGEPKTYGVFSGDHTYVATIATAGA